MITSAWKATLTSIALLAAHPASAQTERSFVNPPDLQPSSPARSAGSRLVTSLTAAQRRFEVPQGEVTFDLNINYTDTTIFNPSTGQDDAVHLRSYNGSLIAPTVNVFPGQTVRIRLHNRLEVESVTDCPPPEGRNHTVPSCRNTSNLHFHGLHVSPTGNSDNVLLEIEPQTTFEYEVNIPADHPAGTFWYHSHRHGSTALQVSSGMVGALIVRGIRTLAERGNNGGVADIDTILTKPEGGALDENILLFQQIAYACFTAPNSSTVLTETASDGTKVWSCPPGQAGQVQYYPTQFGPPAWRASGHYTLITGTVQPTFGNAEGQPIRAGDLQRLRMIHAGVRDTINFKLVQATGLAADESGPPAGAQEQANWVNAHCKDGQVVPQWEFAVDGLTRMHPQLKEVNVLQPAYRSDVLVAFPAAGAYCVLDDLAPANGIINPQAGGKDRRLLGMVQVEDGTPLTGDAAGYIVERLIAANPGIPADVAAQMRSGDLSAFVPTSDLSGSTPVQTRDVAFNIAFPIGDPLRFEVNDAIYNPARVDFRPLVGTIEDWNVTSQLAAHVFHIHVNPFEIMDIRDPSGNSIFAEDGHCTEMDLPKPDAQYCDQKGLFRDTIFIKQGYHIILRTAYTRYIGEYVLHCHILDHEDQGMMLNVEVMPQGENQLAAGAMPGLVHAHGTQ